MAFQWWNMEGCRVIDGENFFLIAENGRYTWWINTPGTVGARFYEDYFISLMVAGSQSELLAKISKEGQSSKLPDFGPLDQPPPPVPGGSGKWQQCIFGKDRIMDKVRKGKKYQSNFERMKAMNTLTDQIKLCDLLMDGVI